MHVRRARTITDLREPTTAVAMRGGDLARLTALHRMLCADRAVNPHLPEDWPTPWMLTAVIPGEPATKARHRSAEGGNYKDRVDVENERHTRHHLGLMVAAGGILRGNLAMACVFYRRTRGIIDADNLTKHVCDAGNGTAWIDDNQITAIAGVIEHDPLHPRTVLVVGPHWSTLERNPQPRPATVRRPRAKRAGRTIRTGQCEGCGKPIAHTLTHCGACREGLRASQRVADLGGLFS